MSNINTFLTYSHDFLYREDAIEEARRLRKAFGNQHIKLVIRDDMCEDYIRQNGAVHWFLRPVFFVEVLVHKESKQIPF